MVKLVNNTTKGFWLVMVKMITPGLVEVTQNIALKFSKKKSVGNSYVGGFQFIVPHNHHHQQATWTHHYNPHQWEISNRQ